ncbi:unnamed protein product [Staurois parvus]|uniref:Uncharacterized protein n=1 Tax=Staurois parvus TaxID=386267 RepID=A0ABN9HEW4_9NEOB|nr:unnamed protein product [Staurois parvus]
MSAATAEVEDTDWAELAPTSCRLPSATHRNESALAAPVTLVREGKVTGERIPPGVVLRPTSHTRGCPPTHVTHQGLSSDPRHTPGVVL